MSATSPLSPPPVADILFVPTVPVLGTCGAQNVSPPLRHTQPSPKRKSAVAAAPPRPKALGARGLRHRGPQATSVRVSAAVAGVGRPLLHGPVEDISQPHSQRGSESGG